jgi:hypothetical protein
MPPAARSHVSHCRATGTLGGAPSGDVEQDEKAGDNGHVENQAEDGDRVPGIALMRLRVLRQWRKHAKQNWGD